MGSSSSNHNKHSDSTAEERPKIIEISPELKAREISALKKYASYEGLAGKSDDQGEDFRSTLVNFLKASALTAKIAVLASSRAEETL